MQLTCVRSTFIHYRPHIDSNPLPHQSSKCHHRKTQYHRLQGAEGVHAGRTTPTLYVHVPVYMHAEAAGRCGCISDGRHSTYRLINNCPDDSTIVRDFALNTSLLGLYDSPEARGTLTGSWHVSLRCSTHAPTNTVGQSFSGELHMASNAPQNPTHATLRFAFPAIRGTCCTLETCAYLRAGGWREEGGGKMCVLHVYYLGLRASLVFGDGDGAGYIDTR